jgi:hypothetical protein
VAANWKTADKETKDYCLTVACIIKERHAELSEAEGVACLSTIDSISPGPKKETKQSSAKSNRMNDYESTESGAICCLPTDQQANDARRRELQSVIPRRASVAFGYQRTNQYPRMCVPTSIDRPVAHEQGTDSYYDNSSTCVLRMYHQQYPHNRMATDSSATIMWGYGNLDLSNSEMPRPIPTSACTQQGIQGSQMSMMKGSNGDNDHGMCAVACEQGMTDSYDNSSTCVMQMYQQRDPHNRMATDSSATMMWGYGNLDLSKAEMPRPIPTSVCTKQGIRGTQMSTIKGRYGDNEHEFPVISNVSQRAMLSNMMNAIHTSKQPIPHREGNRSFGQHRRWSAPECLQARKQEQLHAMHQAQELDITDSDVVGMWLSSEIQEED